MAVLIPGVIGLDVNSDPASGSINLTPNLARFEILLTEPLSIPEGAFDCTVQVDEATVSNTVHNISAELQNNTIRFNINFADADIVIPDGTYDVNTLAEAVKRELGIVAGTQFTTWVDLLPDLPTQKVKIVLNPPGGNSIQIDFTQPNNISSVIGFDNNTFVPPGGPVTGELYEQLGDSVARFNNVEYFLIHWDGGQGIRTNDSFSQTISRVNITSAAGTQVVDAPFHPTVSEASSLIGSPRKGFQFWLTDQNGVEVNTHEFWSARLSIHYSQLVFAPDPTKSNTTGFQMGSSVSTRDRMFDTAIHHASERDRKRKRGMDGVPEPHLLSTTPSNTIRAALERTGRY